MRGQPVRRVVVVCGFGLFLGLLGFLPAEPRIHLNRSGSAPKGLYHNADGDIAVGDYVNVSSDLVWFPASWKERETTLLKRVAAVGGQHVRVGEDAVYVDGIAMSGTAPTATIFASPAQGFDRELEAGEVFLLSSAERAYDSRYFGALEITQVTKVVKLWE